VIAFLLAACLDNDALPDGDAFVAMQADFAGYPSWEIYPVPAGGTGHVDGERTVYLNEAPPDGATSFPLGTILVKTIAWSGGLDVHAMVKRGGGYNADGAVGWEWFELVPDDDGTPVIRWRGDKPPKGELYGQLPGVVDTGAPPTVSGDCNVCHSTAAANDFVHTVPLGGGAP
jgi:hypothetical protein